MPRGSSFATLSSCTIIVACAALTSFAGDLNPPAGPVVPTPGPEPRIAINVTNTPGDANSLFRIAQSGSYYLIGDITGVASRHGIEIGADDVSIDLKGFTLRGVPGSLDGISDDGIERRNVRVANGTIRDWGNQGVDFGFCTNLLVSEIIARSNGSIGIHCRGNAIVESCIADENGANGISCTSVNAIVRTCTANLNTGSGISVGLNGSVTGCNAYENGFRGISTGSAGVVANCSIRLNFGDGLVVGTGSVVTHCAAVDNGDDGILAGLACTVTDCNATNNGGDGIEISSDSLVRHNTCHVNGFIDGAGIHVTSDDNRIEGNKCTNNDRGIDVDGAGNLIIRNSCSGNTTNWDIVAGNVGLVVNALTGGAIMGNSGGTAPGTTDPNANFTY